MYTSDLVTVSCSDHGSRLASGLWSLFSACHGVDHDVGSVRVHRLVLDVFLSTPKLTREVKSDDDGVLYSLLEFLYTGKVTVRRDKLEVLLEVARASDFYMLVDVLQTLTDGSQAGNEPGSASTLVDAASGLAMVPVVEPRSIGATDCKRQGVQNPDAYDSPVAVKAEVSSDFEGEEGKDDLDFELDEVNRERGHPSCSSSVTSAGASRSDRGGQRKGRERKELNFATGSGDDADPQRWNLQVKKIKLEEPGEEVDGVMVEEEQEKGSSDQPKKKIHKCDVCGLVTTANSKLTVHKRSHTGERPYKCHICQESFTQPGNMKRHIRKHTGERPFRCSICNAGYTSSRSLARHAKLHSVDKLFSCDSCQATFARRDEVLHHVATVHGMAAADAQFSECPIEKRYSCTICHAVFETHQDLVEHAKSHLGVAPFHCDSCQVSFPTQRALNAHRSSHDTRSEPYTCVLCNKTFHNCLRLKTHLKTHSDGRPFQCNVCDKSFRCSQQLNQHARIHREERPYKCDECPKTFLRNRQLVIHRRMHSGERPFQCHVCHKTYPSRDSLTCHLKFHAEVKKYKCDVCSKAFHQNGLLLRHRRRFHAQEVTDSFVSNSEPRELAT